MIMIILEYVYVEIVRGWYINSAIKKKKTSRIHRLSAIYQDVFCSSRVTRKY